jgi:hypothetical protein
MWWQNKLHHFQLIFLFNLVLLSVYNKIFLHLQPYLVIYVPSHLTNCEKRYCITRSIQIWLFMRIFWIFYSVNLHIHFLFTVIFKFSSDNFHWLKTSYRYNKSRFDQYLYSSLFKDISLVQVMLIYFCLLCLTKM